MAILQVEDIQKRFGRTRVLEDISFSLEQGQAMAIIGSSGSGKTTLLRCLNFLEKPEQGTISVAGNLIFDAADPATQRESEVRKKRLHFGLVFQSFNLFPQYTALKNVTLARELLAQEQPDFKQNKKQILEEIQADGRELLAKMGLSERANHYPSQLSGGQQQRVALARAVVIEPSVLLFDEPLSNLDAKLRESMRDELRALQKRLGITSLYVTHDQSEAMAISDRVVIMKDGVICQQGTPTEIYEQPNSRFVANFIGKANFIDGTFRGMDGENALVEVGGHTFPIPAPGKMEGVQKDGPCCLAVRPESILLSEEEGPLPGRVSRATYYGAKVEYEVMLGDQPIIVEVYNPQLSKRFAEGEAVHMTLIDRCVRVLA